MSVRERDQKWSLVLSIFKGENFVCKKPSGYRCQITAKLGNEMLESAVVNLHPSNNEPVFNCQLAWTVSKKELTKIRANGESVKVECVLLSDRSNGVVGYCVLYAKDAFTLSDIHEIDPINAKSVTLLGTKDPWRNYKPKLQLSLHMEDQSQSQKMTQSSQHKATVKSPGKTKTSGRDPDQVDSVGLFDNAVDNSYRKSLAFPAQNASMFNWNVNEEMGYFELGPVSENDDLYMLNITIVSATYLHKIWDGRSPKKPQDVDYTWTVNYKAYGCDIKSDPFKLSHEDEESRRTFIGDKATARIRSNGAMFCEYLSQTSLDFRVLRYMEGQHGQLINQEVMGLSFVELKDLTKPEIHQLKITLDLVSEWGTPRLVHEGKKPEVRVLIDLEVTPNFFKNMLGNDDSRMFLPSNNNNSIIESSKEEDDEEVKVFDNTNPKEEKECDKKDLDRDSVMEDILEEINHLSLKEQNHAQQKLESNSEAKVVQKGEFPSDFTSDAVGDEVQPHPNVISPHVRISENNIQKVTPEDKPPVNESSSQGRLSPRAEQSASTSTSTATSSGDNSLTETYSQLGNSNSTNNNDDSKHTSVTNKQNLNAVITAGTYEITIKLSKMFLKSRRDLEEPFTLSYVHPPIGIVEQPVFNHARPDPSIVLHNDPKKKCCIIDDGTYKFVVALKPSEQLLTEPMTVEIRLSKTSLNKPYIAFCLIPFGSIFFQRPKNNKRVVKTVAEVLKYPDNAKIGYIEYCIVLESCAPFQNRYSTPRYGHDEVDIATSPMNDVVESKYVFNTIHELEEWKLEQQKEFKNKLENKERAYLTIMSAENKKQNEMREKALNDKLTELKKKETDLNKQIRLVKEREDNLREKEFSVNASARQITIDQTNNLENAKIRIKRMQEEHAIEIESLKRRLEEYHADNQRYKGKVSVLEKKLDLKETEVRDLIASGSHMPDAKLAESARVLQSECSNLKKQLSATEKQRDDYKHQARNLLNTLTRIQAEKDMQLKDENENLKLQILASKEQKEIKKERKVIQGISNQIRVLKENVKAQPEESSTGNVQVLNEHPRRSASATRYSGDVDKPSGSENITQPVPKRHSEGGDFHRNDVDVSEAVVNSKYPSGRDRTSKDDEISRLTRQRSGMLATGAYTQFDLVIKEMERKIVKLANETGNH